MMERIAVRILLCLVYLLFGAFLGVGLTSDRFVLRKSEWRCIALLDSRAPVTAGNCEHLERVLRRAPRMTIT